jgi:hypothetical protein
MNIEKFAAHYMFSAEGKFVKWPVVTVGEGGVILKIETHSDKFREQPGTHFFSGILLPGFIDVCGNLFVDTIGDEKRFLNRHFRDGTLILGVSGKFKNSFRGMSDLPVIIPKRFPCKGHEAFFDSRMSANTSLLQRIKLAMGDDSRSLSEELLTYATIDSAGVAGLSKFGRLEEGLAPGLLLLQNADLINLKLNTQTTVKWLNVPDLLLKRNASEL